MNPSVIMILTQQELKSLSFVTTDSYYMYFEHCIY